MVTSNQVRKLIKEGKSYAQAAKELGISTSQAYYYGKVKGTKRRTTRRAKPAVKSCDTMAAIEAVMGLKVSDQVKLDLVTALVGK